jgi:signal transduction histidine kinase
LGSGLHLLVIAFLGTIAASGMAGWSQAVFVILSVAAGGTVLFRRRHPWALLLLAWAATVLASQVLLIPALFNLGVRRHSRLGLPALGVTLLLLAIVAPRGELLVSIDGVESDAWPYIGSWILNGIAVVVVPFLIGRGVAVRRDLVESYRIRAEHAEAERSARAAESVLLERTRIAREAHDILGHKLSLLALQAGGLKLNARAGAEVVEEQAQLIEQSARGALNDLRSIIHSIEVPGAHGSEQVDDSLIPQDLFGIRKLVDQSVLSGATVNFVTSGLTHPEELPEDVARAAYRVAQECLTNAHVHAPGAPVVVSLSGSPGEKFVVEVRNTVTGPEGNGTRIRRGGKGLPGLRERVRVVGGELMADEIDSVFIVRARIPWPSDQKREGRPRA